MWIEVSLLSFTLPKMYTNTLIIPITMQKMSTKGINVEPTKQKWPKKWLLAKHYDEASL